jgi:hypothetical protein
MTITKKAGNQTFQKFEIWLHAVPAKLATEAAQRRGMEPAELIEEVSSGVFVRGHIEKQREHWSDWKLSKRATWRG